MIFDALLALFTTLINGIFSALPVWTLEQDNSAISKLFFQLTIYNSVLPVSELFFIIGLCTAVFACSHALKWGIAGYNAIRGSGA